MWRVGLDELEKIHRGTLFAGHVDACDSTVQVHESLALTIIQIGIALVGYHGEEGTWAAPSLPPGPTGIAARTRSSWPASYWSCATPHSSAGAR